MKEYTIPGTDVVLRYHDLPGDGTPILFLHGLGCAGSLDYPEVAAQPPLLGRRRILFDLLGSGFSDRPQGFDYSIPSHGKYLAGLIADLDLPRVALYGHSMGGAVALSLAARCKNRLDRIILSEANLDSGGGTFSRAIAKQAKSDFLESGYSSLIRDSRGKSSGLWAAGLAASDPTALYEESVSLIEGQSPSWREILYGLDCPKAYLFGERSLPDPDAEELARHGIRVAIVPEAGHSMAWQNSAGLARAIAAGLE